MKTFSKFKYSFLLLLLPFGGCDTTESTLGGAALGTAAGAGMGYAFGGKGGAAVGGVLGGLGGGALGHHVGKTNEQAAQSEAYAQENRRLRERQQRLDADRLRREDQDSAQYREIEMLKKEKELENYNREKELKNLRYEIERNRLENEKLKLQLERKGLAEGSLVSKG